MNITLLASCALALQSTEPQSNISQQEMARALSSIAMFAESGLVTRSSVSKLLTASRQSLPSRRNIGNFNFEGLSFEIGLKTGTILVFKDYRYSTREINLAGTPETDAIPSIDRSSSQVARWKKRLSIPSDWNESEIRSLGDAITLSWSEPFKRDELGRSMTSLTLNVHSGAISELRFFKSGKRIDRKVVRNGPQASALVYDQFGLEKWNVKLSALKTKLLYASDMHLFGQNGGDVVAPLTQHWVVFVPKCKPFPRAGQILVAACDLDEYCQPLPENYVK